MSRMMQALAVVGVLSAFGRLIDSLVQSEKGQAVVKTLWYRFAEIELESFAQSEAKFAVRFLDGVFGARTFCLKRWIFIGCAFALSLGIGFAVSLGSNGVYWQRIVNQDTRNTFAIFARFSSLFSVVSICVALFTLSISLSVSRLFAIATSKVPSHRPWVSVSIFVLFLILQLWMTVIGTAIAAFIPEMLLQAGRMYVIYLAGGMEGKAPVTNGLFFFGAIVFSVVRMLYVAFFVAPLHTIATLPFKLPFFLVFYQFSGDNLFETSLAVANTFLGYEGAIIRLSIAVVFVVSYASLPYKDRLWRWMDALFGSTKPTFYNMFGLLGLFIALLELILSFF